MWFNNPIYKKTRSAFKENIHPRNLTHLHYSLPKILFICGGDDSVCENRGIVEDYFECHNPSFLTFRAEYAWDVISREAGGSRTVNALSLEEWLADFSDAVVILVESFGTVAELGAFSLSEPLRKKLLPILDKEYQSDASFINTGPVSWVDVDSKFSPSIYTDFQTILTCMPEVENRLDKLKYSHDISSKQYGKYFYSPKVLLFCVLYVVASLGPISESEVSKIVSNLIGLDPKEINVIPFMLSVGVALGVFGEFRRSEKESYFTCMDYKKFFRGRSQDLLHKIQRSRARSLSNLIKIPEFREVLKEVSKNVA